MTMTAPKIEAPPRVTTAGPCPHCGHRCKAWAHAAVFPSGTVDGAALMLAHDVEADEVMHDDDGKVVGGAAHLVPMVDTQSVSHKKHGGRIAPIPPPWKGSRR